MCMYVALRRCSAFATRATLQPSPTSRCLLLRLRFKSHPPRRPNFEAVCEAEADLSTPLLLGAASSSLAAVVRVDASFGLHLLASFRRVSTHHSGFDLLPAALYGSVLDVEKAAAARGGFLESFGRRSKKLFTETTTASILGLVRSLHHPCVVRRGRILLLTHTKFTSYYPELLARRCRNSSLISFLSTFHSPSSF